MENADLDEPLCAFVGTVGGAIVSVFVECVDFAHFGQHRVLLIDFVLFDVFVEFLLPDLLPLFEAAQVF